MGYRPALDGLRAIAILLVIGKHGFNYPEQGGLGVDLFFVLSGFLITTLLLEEYAHTGTISLRSFYRRRVLRLFPALAAMLAIVIPLLLWGTSSHIVLVGLVGAFTYTSNVLFVVAPHEVPHAIKHLWSLAQEEQFYAIWPLALLLFIRRGHTQLARYVLMTALFASMILCFVFAVRGAGLNRVYFSPDTRSGPIIIGCLAGLALHQKCLPAFFFRRSDREFLAATTLVLLLVIPFVVRQWQLLYALPGHVVFAAIAALLILCCATDGATAATRLLTRSPLRFIGTISYALYLWHFPVFSAFGVRSEFEGWRSIIAAAISFFAAVASYYIVELPFLRMKRRAARPASTTATPIPAPAVPG